MANEATPRVNASYLESFTNQTVRIVGKVLALHGETATLDAGGEISIHLDRESHLTVSHAAEIIGKVQPDLSIRVLQATDFGANLGMHTPFPPPRPSILNDLSRGKAGSNYAAANAVVDATHRYKEIFYEASGGE